LLSALPAVAKGVDQHLIDRQVGHYDGSLHCRDQRLFYNRE
jgi:hypothetical protein